MKVRSQGVVGVVDLFILPVVEFLNFLYLSAVSKSGVGFWSFLRLLRLTLFFIAFTHRRG